MKEQLTRAPVLAQNVELNPKLDSRRARQVFRENLYLSIFIPVICTRSGWNLASRGDNQHMGRATAAMDSYGVVSSPSKASPEEG
ncbi:hypothetical protein [Laspinema olomoucense]|uniref:Uncharacterized protein n=1 Tax=Laspinema olomoucense D3b TaxID=2953688 RepID=A0ABT2N7K2_9CYAN|nr:hypothetical protein [Laspinema sp. D3b]MCT7978664.1 hypothetical protein [Laspinema sp. D3b]